MKRFNPKSIRLSATDARLAEIRATIAPYCPNKVQQKGFEDAYSDSVPREHRRRLGQFFTPYHAAALMADWVTAATPKTVLDPAVGPGLLLDEVAKRNQSVRLCGYDIDPLCIDYAEARLKRFAHTLHVADFLTADVEPGFCAVIANPPYIRHHDLNYDFDIFRDFAQRYGIALSRLSNAYALFIVKCLSLLKPGGRAAFIIPAEWSNSNFGSALKKHFASTNILRHVIYFNHEGLVFSDNLSTGCLLLIENAPSADLVHTHYVPADINANSLEQLEKDSRNCRSTFSAAQLASFGKWDFFVSRGLQEDIPGLVCLKELAYTRRGIATGANSYFYVGAEVVGRYGISKKHIKPCIGKARFARSFVFSTSDWEELERKGSPAYLLDFQGPLSKGDQHYIKYGLEQGINKRYLTKSRSPWYSMEKQTIAPIWAAVFGRGAMRFIVNDAGVRTLTAFHCVYPTKKDRLHIKALAACLNSKCLQDRARAKSRVYGGGLLKFEPRDLLDIEVPDLRVLSDASIKRLATSFEALEEATRSRSKHFDWENLDAIVLSAAEEAASRNRS